MRSKAMLANPQLNQSVEVRYAKTYRDMMPLHRRIGRVVVVGKGKPRNHGVEIGGKVFAIPCGNLFKITTNTTSAGEANV